MLIIILILKTGSLVRDANFIKLNTVGKNERKN